MTEPTPTMAGNMRIRISGVPIILCAVCGTPMRKTRPWSQFCGDKCRKAYHRNIRVSGIAPDIRATLTRIESALRSLVDVNNENRALDLARRVEALEKRP